MVRLLFIGLFILCLTWIINNFILESKSPVSKWVNRSVQSLVFIILVLLVISGLPKIGIKPSLFLQKLGLLLGLIQMNFQQPFSFFIKISCMVWPKRAVLITLRLLKLSYMEVIGNLMSIQGSSLDANLLGLSLIHI